MLNEQTATLLPDAPAPDQFATTAEPAESTSQFDQLRMLSQAPLSLEQALQKEATVVAEDVEEAPATAFGLLSRFAGQLALFIGVGLVAAAVVHHSADPTLYKLLALGGGVLFAGGSILSAPKATQGGIVATVSYGITSLALGLGTGLLVGGILHFSAAPRPSTVTIPLGLAIAIGAFFVRDGRQFIGKGIVPTAVTLVGLLVWLSLGLAFGAKKIDPPATPGTPAAEQGTPAAGGDHGATPAGEHGEAAAGEHGTPAAGEHDAAPAGEHDAAATAEHGAEKTEAAASGEHGAAAAEGEHGAAATAADHGTTTADHGATKATADHSATKATADHGAAKATADHGATKETADHGTAKAASHEAVKPKYAEPAAGAEHDAAATGHETVSKYASPEDAAGGH